MVEAVAIQRLENRYRLLEQRLQAALERKREAEEEEGRLKCQMREVENERYSLLSENS